MKKLSNSMSNPKYRPDIDGLRAIAVLAVVIFHAYPNLLAGGFIGVDVFFVISGFLISTIIFQSLENRSFSFIDFYRRRINRIFPALICMFSFAYVVGWFVLFADEFEQLGKHIVAGAAFLSNFVLWSEVDYFDNSADTKPLLHLWSLAIEEQFYIFYPLLLSFIFRFKVRKLLPLIVLIFSSFLVNILSASENSIAAFYSPFARFWEMLCGGLVSYVFVSNKSLQDIYKTYSNRAFFSNLYEARYIKLLLDSVSACGFFLLIAGFILIDENSPFPGFIALIPVCGAMFLILAGQDALINKKILSNGALVAVGLISYPLYLWHWPILSFGRILQSGELSAFLKLILVAVAMLLAWLTYRFIEKPVRSGRLGENITKYFVALMIVLGLAGFHLYSHEGYLNRAAQKNYQSNKSDLVRTVAQDDACLAYIGKQSSKFRYCRFVSVGSGSTVAVVGDSHAHVAFPGVAALGSLSQLNTVLLANSSCPPLLGAPFGVTVADQESCSVRIAEIIETVVSKIDIKKVFLFVRGPTYWTGTEPISGDKDVLNGARIEKEKFFSGAQKTIAELVKHGKQVYWVTENPELSHVPEACITRPMRISTKDCRPHKAEVLARFDTYFDEVKKLKNVTIIDGLDVFCPDQRCLVFDKSGKLLYADADHLSVSGSHFQAREIVAPFLR